MPGSDWNDMDCNRWRDALSAMADGESADIDERLVAAHVARCPECQAVQGDDRVVADVCSNRHCRGDARHVEEDLQAQRCGRPCRPLEHPANRAGDRRSSGDRVRLARTAARRGERRRDPLGQTPRRLRCRLWRGVVGGRGPPGTGTFDPARCIGACGRTSARRGRRSGYRSNPVDRRGAPSAADHQRVPDLVPRGSLRPSRPHQEQAGSIDRALEIVDRDRRAG